jgi:hypothetical protein
VNTALLIDAIVRQTTVLIAALATAAGQRTNTDVGKLALCTTGVELGLCDESWNCACLNDSVLCKGTSMCSCTAKGCGVQWRNDYRIEADVDLEQGVMHVRQENGQYRLPFVMHRVSPRPEAGAPRSEAWR